MRTFKQITRWLCGVLYIAAGINHFVDPGFYVPMMPDYLPWHLELVYLSGITEALLGVLLIVPRTSRWAAWGLIALLLAIFPANINMALHPEQFDWATPIALYLRLPMQAVLIAWAWWYTRPDAKPAVNAA